MVKNEIGLHVASEKQHKIFRDVAHGLMSILLYEVRKTAKIRNWYNQVPHLTQDINRKVTNLWLFVGPTGVYLLDFFCSGIQFNLLLSPFPCFISLLYLDLYVLGDDALIS